MRRDRGNRLFKNISPGISLFQLILCFLNVAIFVEPIKIKYDELLTDLIDPREKIY